jgi:hypothetical protein
VALVGDGEVAAALRAAAAGFAGRSVVPSLALGARIQTVFTEV